MSSVYVIESPDSAKGDWRFDTPSHPDPRCAHADATNGITKSPAQWDLPARVGITQKSR
jgi:hypothetical protein